MYTNEFTRKSTPSSGRCARLEYNTVLTSLDVSDNSLGRDAAKADAELEEPESALRVLLRGQRFKQEGGKYLAHCLKTRVQLKASTRRAIGWKGVGGVARRRVKKNSALCHLNLEKNGLGTGGKSIAVAVQDNHALVSLDLSDNGPGRRAASISQPCSSRTRDLPRFVDPTATI